MILSDCDIAQGKRMVDQLIHEIAAYRFYWQGGCIVLAPARA
ncbi:hypothetical protein Q8004_04725 [Edwardsiella piscicida]|nr:hypothetical protein Q8004_04725 [Edwardsiella piscicida]